MVEGPLDDAEAARSVNPAFTAEVSDRGDATVVRLVGELDMATVSRAGLALKDAVAPRKPVVVDLTGLTFFSSAGLNLLVDLNGLRGDPPLDIRLVGDQRVVLLPLELAGLSDLFPMHATLDEAFAAPR